MNSIHVRYHVYHTIGANDLQTTWKVITWKNKSTMSSAVNSLTLTGLFHRFLAIKTFTVTLSNQKSGTGQQLKRQMAEVQIKFYQW